MNCNKLKYKIAVIQLKKNVGIIPVAIGALGKVTNRFELQTYKYKATVGLDNGDDAEFVFS